MTERIEAAAIKYGELVCAVERPGRHHNVFWEMDRLKVPHLSDPGIQGFVTSSGRFVGRIEARKIAEASGQLIKSCVDADGGPFTREHEQLFSEDVW